LTSEGDVVSTLLASAGIGLDGGTLDAIHLATAILSGAADRQLPTMATHDADLARGARAMGMIAIGA
jgi:predicted nucleic acid-binding protein